MGYTPSQTPIPNSSQSENPNVYQAIQQAAAKYGVDPKFALSIAQTESNLNQNAISNKGAIGVMQLMPTTASQLGVDPHDVLQNIDGGVRYIKQLLTQFHGNYSLAAAAYNAGAGNVTKYNGIPPIPETQDYVNKVMSRYNGSAPSNAYNLNQVAIPYGQSNIIDTEQLGMPQYGPQQAPVDYSKIFSGIGPAAPGMAGASLGQGKPENWLNKVIDNINDFLGTNQRPSVLAVQGAANDLSGVGPTTAQLMQKYGVAGINNFNWTVANFVSQASFGIVKNPYSFVNTGSSVENALEGTMGALSSVGGMFAGFEGAGAVAKMGIEAASAGMSIGSAALRGTADFTGLAKLFSGADAYANAAEKIDAVVSNPELVKVATQLSPSAQLFYNMAKTGAVLGAYNGITSFMENNQVYNNYYTAIDKAAPEALQGLLFGATAATLGTALFQSTIGRAITAVGLKNADIATKVIGGVALQNITQFITHQPTSLSQIADGIRNGDPQLIISSLMNTMFAAAIGLGAHDSESLKPDSPNGPKSNPDIQNIKEAADTLSDTFENMQKATENGSSAKYNGDFREAMASAVGSKEGDAFSATLDEHLDPLIDHAAKDEATKDMSANDIDEDKTVVTSNDNINAKDYLDVARDEQKKSVEAIEKESEKIEEAVNEVNKETPEEAAKAQETIDGIEASKTEGIKEPSEAEGAKEQSAEVKADEVKADEGVNPTKSEEQQETTKVEEQPKAKGKATKPQVEITPTKVAYENMKPFMDSLKSDLDNYKGMKRVVIEGAEKPGIEPVAGFKPSFIKSNKMDTFGLSKDEALGLIKKAQNDKLDPNEQLLFNNMIEKYADNEGSKLLDPEEVQKAKDYIDLTTKIDTPNPTDEATYKELYGDTYMMAGIPIGHWWKGFKDKFFTAYDKSGPNFLKINFSTPFWWSFSKDPMLKRAGVALKELGWHVSVITLDFRKGLYDRADEYSSLVGNVAKDATGKDYPGFIKAVNKAIVEGDKEGKNPIGIFQNKGDYLQYTELANKIFNKHKEFYDLARQKINEFTLRTLHTFKDVLSPEQMKFLQEYFYKELTVRPYYMPRERPIGNIIVKAIDSNGRVVEREHFYDPTAGLAQGTFRPDVKKSIARMRDKYGSSYTVRAEEAKPTEVGKLDAMNLMTVLQDVMHNSDLTEEQKATLMKKTMDNAMAQGFMSHTIRRSDSYIAGYEEDPVKAMQSYLAQASGFVSKQTYKIGLNNIEQAQSAKWTNAMRNAWSAHKDQLLRNKTAFDTTIHLVRSGLYLRYIALNLRSAFVNLTFQQPIIAMHLASEIGNGVRSSLEAAPILAKASADVLHSNFSPREKATMDFLNKMGVTSDQYNQFSAGRSMLMSGAWNKLMQIGGTFMKYTEIFNRRVAALSYMRAHPEIRDADELAYGTRDFVYRTNGKYGDSELSVMFQKRGAMQGIGKIGQTLQTYTHQMMLGFIKLHNEKQYAALLFGAGTLMAMGGLGVLPLYKTIQTVYRDIEGRDLELDIQNGIHSGFINNLMNGGLLGHLPFGLATDVSNNAGFSLPTDDLTYSTGGLPGMFMSQYLGVGYDTLIGMTKSLKFLAEGNLAQAALNSPIPRFLAFPLKALQDYKWGITSNGNIVMTDPMTGQPMRPTVQESFMQSIGFTPERIQQFKNLYFSYKDLTSYYQSKRQNILSQYQVAANNGDKNGMMNAMEAIQTLNQKVMQLNTDYGSTMPMSRIHTANTSVSGRSMNNFLRSNMIKGGMNNGE